MVDAIRGYALLGVFMVHMAEYFELFWHDPRPTAVTHAVFALFMGKAFALLALCFGFSHFIIIDGARRRGEPFQLRFAWRLVLLAMLGTLHGLLYRGDITVTLALAGFVLLLCDRIRSNAVLVGLSIGCLLQPSLLLWIVGGLAAEPWALHPAHYVDDPAMQAYLGGSLRDVLAANLVAGQATKWWFLLDSGRLEQIVGLGLLGLVLGRTGFFAQVRRFRRSRFIALLGCVSTIVIVQVARRHGILVNGGPLFWADKLLMSWLDLAVMGTSLLLFIWAWQAGGDPFLRLLAPVGRMTLTLYIGQSVLFVPVFYGFGLGLYASISQAQALVLGIVAFAMQVAFANLWFGAFHYGPLEWLWRAGTRLSRDVPFRRRTAASSGSSLTPAGRTPPRRA